MSSLYQRAPYQGGGDGLRSKSPLSISSSISLSNSASDGFWKMEIITYLAYIFRKCIPCDMIAFVILLGAFRRNPRILEIMERKKKASVEVTAKKTSDLRACRTIIYCCLKFAQIGVDRCTEKLEELHEAENVGLVEDVDSCKALTQCDANRRRNKGRQSLTPIL